MSDLLRRLFTETWPAKAAKSAIEALMLPGQIAGGELATQPSAPGMWSDVDEARSQATQQGIGNRATDLAGLLMGGSYGAAPAGSAGIFGGRLAATADQAALRRAEDMASKGASREQIWNDTGWFQGADGKWRFEIDDSKAVFQGLNPEPQHTPLRAALRHPDLINAYPDASRVRVHETTFGPGRSEHGVYHSGLGVDDPDIRIGWSVKDKRSTLLHELQHDVQAREGFARGGNMMGLKPGTVEWDIYQERLKAMKTPLDRATYSKVAGYGDDLASEAEYKKYIKIIKRPNAAADRAAQEYAVQSGYKRTAGEVEARNVQTRMDMTPEQRRAAPPWSTQDVPDEMQIVLQRMLGAP